MEPDMQAADFLEDSMSCEATIDLSNALLALRARVATPEDRELLERASSWLALLRGGLRAYEGRLNGDMATVPDKALAGVVDQYFNDDPARARALELARDVRLLCFFRAIDRGSNA